MENELKQAPLIKNETANDCTITQFTIDFNNIDTTPAHDAQLSPPQKTNVYSQSEHKTTATDIAIALSSTSTQTEKLLLPLPSSITDEAHDTTTESFSTPDTTMLSPPPPPSIDNSRDDQTTNNNNTPTVASPSQQQQPLVELRSVTAADNNDNSQAENKLLSPLETSLLSPSIDSIHNDPAANNTTSHMDTSSSNSVSETSATSPSSPPFTNTTTDIPSSTDDTTTKVEAPSAGGKTKRAKRKPYQTPTEEQLKSLVNGHLNDKLSISAAARRAGIARSTASSLMKKHKAQGSIPKRQPRGRTAPAKIQTEQAEWIDRYLRDNESATLETIRVALLLAFPKISQISLSGLQRNITLKCTRHLKRRRQNKNDNQP